MNKNKKLTEADILKGLITNKSINESRDEDLEYAVESYINGQRKQMVRQIDEYGLYDFWADLKFYLRSFPKAFDTFSGMVIAYHQIKNR